MFNDYVASSGAGGCHGSGSLGGVIYAWFEAFRHRNCCVLEELGEKVLRIFTLDRNWRVLEECSSCFGANVEHGLLRIVLLRSNHFIDVLFCALTASTRL